ncbi:alpha/beta hydrolase family protein [Paenibacillus koleovorans]|uniref:alpha/beta hydrolase family protein n=1 Tax=Paenibacillus koleovorans TaxID=121608 RepID=UPI000FD9FEEB|nr:alpha/beta fold hydrolase [Paenibacillus koleovorans]
MEHTISIPYRDDQLRATIHYPTRNGKNAGIPLERCPAIVFCHGFVGNRIGVDRLFVHAARQFSDAGYVSIRFDFAGCGESSGDYGSGGLGSMIEQTRTVLDYLLDADYVDADRITLIGHSLGGAAALLTAAQDKRVKSLVLWSAVAHPFNDIVRIVGQSGYDQAIQQGQSDYLGYSLKPVFFESLAEVQPLAQVRKFSGDVLLIHGTSDDTIPSDYSSIYQKVFWMRQDGQCELEWIFQGDHTYSSGPSKTKLYSLTLEWLKERERQKREWQNWEI